MYLTFFLTALAATSKMRLLWLSMLLLFFGFEQANASNCDMKFVSFKLATFAPITLKEMQDSPVCIKSLNSKELDYLIEAAKGLPSGTDAARDDLAAIGLRAIIVCTEFPDPIYLNDFKIFYSNSRKLNLNTKIISSLINSFEKKCYNPLLKNSPSDRKKN